MGRFSNELTRPGLQAIAEIKRRSPSAGDLRPDADPVVIAAAFGEAGAAAISVLVDERFGGSIDDLRDARGATATPLLAKGFFSTEEQIEELAESGADAVLLILRDLDDEQVRSLQALANQMGMDALVEAHTAEELDRAVALQADVIGINCRDLATFEIDRAAQLQLVARAPRDRIVVAESGIHTRAQGAMAELAGADAILVGSALMQAPEPAEKLRELISRPLIKICGLTREEDVAAAIEAGADMTGFILAQESPRRVDAPLAVPDTVISVGVFVGERHAAGTDLSQLYEREGDHRARDAQLLLGDEEVAKVLDLPWKQEDPGHLERARAERGRVMLAGGLSPENVGGAIEQVRPWAVDASSSLEIEPGVKDHERIRAFVDAVRGTVRA